MLDASDCPKVCPSEVLFEQEDNEDVVREYGTGTTPNTRKNEILDVIPICLRGRECGIVLEFMKYFGCLRANTSVGVNYVWDNKVIRKLTPLEYERLQGMPDNHTKISNGNIDNLRRKSIGNSMSVPVIHWIGKRVQISELGIV